MPNPTEIKNKDQFVIAYLPDFEKEEIVLSHAIFLSKMIDKGLILLHICDKHYSKLSTDQAEERLKEIQQKISSQVSATYAAIPGKTKTIINALPTLIGAVAIVGAIDPHASIGKPTNKRTFLNLFHECKIAYLTVQKPLEDSSVYQQVCTTIDFKKESKEKLIWTSYFARFNKSQINVMYYDYKDEGLHTKWYNNMRFLHKFFNNLNLTFTPHIIPSNHSTFTDINALKEIEQQQMPCGVMLCVTTWEKDAIEWFYGTQEQRTIVNKLGIPVMFLNPRDDLYVLCD